MQNNRFDKFTNRARKVLSLAQEEAQRFNHSYIAPVHLLLGMLREGDGVAAKALSDRGISYDRARAAVEQALGRGDRITLGEIGLTPAAKRMIELAVDEPRRLNHGYIGTEHLLLGLLRTDDEDLDDVLQTLGPTRDELRADTEKLLSTVSQGPQPGSTPRSQQPSPLPAPTSSRPPRPGTQASTAPDEYSHRLTERARKVLTLAQEEAQRFNHNYIGTEHLLLGLIREGDGIGAHVLRNLGVELNQVRSAVEFIIGRGDRIVLGEISLTPRSKKVMALAADEAKRLNHNYIGTEHLLLGLIREGDGIAAGVLESLHVNLERAREETIRMLQSRGNGSPTDGGSSDGGPEPSQG